MKPYDEGIHNTPVVVMGTKNWLPRIVRASKWCEYDAVILDLCLYFIDTQFSHHVRCQVQVSNTITCRSD